MDLETALTFTNGHFNQVVFAVYTFVLNELLVCLTYIGRNDDPNLPLKLSTVYYFEGLVFCSVW